MPNWNEFYNKVKADNWPQCDNEQDFDQLPENIKFECINEFGYNPSSFKVIEVLEENKAFCILPFLHLYIDENNDVAYCCKSSSIKQHTEQFDFYTDADYVNTRQLMKDRSFVKQCNSCYKMEANSGISPRMINTKEWFEKLKITSIDQVEEKLRYYDIRNDSLCNLKCRMCSPRSSTQLQKEYKEIGIPFTINSNKLKLNQVVDYTTVEKIYIAGGEPTLMPEVSALLSKCIENNRKDVNLTIITNGTNVNSAFVDSLKEFTDVNITLSLDGYDQLNRYIRWPSDWDTIVTNIEKLKSITDHLSVNIAANIINVTRLYELVSFLETVLPSPATILINEVTYGPYVPFNFPDRELAIEKNSLLKNTYSYAHEEMFKNKVDYFISVFENSHSDKAQLKEFFKFNDLLDNHRGVYLKDIVPELEKFRHE